jgi:hypothetical protein
MTHVYGASSQSMLLSGASANRTRKPRRRRNPEKIPYHSGLKSLNSYPGEGVYCPNVGTNPSWVNTEIPDPFRNTTKMEHIVYGLSTKGVQNRAKVFGGMVLPLPPGFAKMLPPQLHESS